MAKKEHLALLKRSVSAWNEWREHHATTRPDLRNANLEGVSLARANLIFANLSGANLKRADLSRAILSEAKLRGTDFTQATLFRTTFSDVDLSVAVGLDKIYHRGPSSIGIDTLYRSAARIPESFLRGAGVPDNLIVYASSLVTRAVEFYSCFISYSSHDQEFAGRLHADLQANGVRCWFAPANLTAGRKIHEQISDAIRLHEKLLLILSPTSMQSEWVQAEIAVARERERSERRHLLFPISLVPYDAIRQWQLFDPESGKDVAREVREYLIPDFSKWKDQDAYRRSFLILLRDLTAGARLEHRHE